MGISPINNLPPLLLDRAVESDFALAPMARVENSARTGDEKYSPSNQKSARGAEDDGPEDDESEDGFDDAPSEDDGASIRLKAGKGLNRPVSFFA
jgi:hypothetical protein